MEIQQSPLYSQYIQRLGWNVEKVDGGNLFIKRFPLYGGFAKLQRCVKLPRVGHLLPILTKHRVKRLAVEPDASVDQKVFSRWLQKVSPHVPIVHSAYLPTKTIRIDLSGSEDETFNRFSEAKRRAVRRALKHHVLIRESSDIHVLINIKNKSSGFLGFITTTGIDKLWPIFAPDHASILLARTSPSPDDLSFPRRRESSILSWIPDQVRNDEKSRVIGGVLLLFWDNIAYYWIAGATHEGKKLFAPTLIVWEALKLAKKRGAKQFDFVGVWDDRTPKQFHEWKGFTKFKEGFGGTSLYYPISSL